ncbi:hypothetical protein K469DRAFT_138665 [Zopfia rhizophila CBS 207.26]|uniref:Uncharacterized protein n=1 Tax=Zopfia rhizophila CBS 207.26 TaxID=1314779 RepID=A0A6A6E3F4_9PEZI|nr:hypothetical protein K469DRAFT_138665 [Zopfia rhizophila CBS 207.26]
MCIYRYVYFSACRHQELIRFEYCDKAKALGLPDRDRDKHWQGGGSDQGRDQANPLDSSLNSPSPTSCNIKQHQALFVDHGYPNCRRQWCPVDSQLTSMATTSEAGTAPDWVGAVPTPDHESSRHADLIPRSVQSDLDVLGQLEHVSSQEHRYNASEGISTLDRSGYDKLQIDFPMDNYSTFSMELIHNDGKVKEIVARLESFRNRQPSSEVLSDDPRVHVGDARTRACSSSSTVRRYESDANTIRGAPSLSGQSNDTAHHTDASTASELEDSSEAFYQHASSLQASQHEAVHAESRTNGAEQNAKGNDKADDTSPHPEEWSPRSPRKPIPSQWIPKRKTPMLKTAQRAIERESRKRVFPVDTPGDSSPKTLRGARSSANLIKGHGLEATTFLTKDAAAAVESDITSPPLARVNSRLRHAASKATVKTPKESPVREHARQHSSIKITMSPSRTTNASNHTHNSLDEGTAAETGESGNAKAGSASSGQTPYVSAKHSPIAKTKDGTKAPLSHSRGKSYPHSAKASTPGGKTTSSRAAVPKLSLKIPHSTSLSAENKSSFILSSGASSGTGSPASPSQSSRIPRISAFSRVEWEGTCEDASVHRGPLKRSKLVRSMISKDPLHVGEGCQGPFTVSRECEPMQGTSTSGSASTELDGRSKVVGIGVMGTVKEPPADESNDPCDIPLPAAPATAVSLRHVKTLNSSGNTPILSCGSPVTATESPTTTQHGSMDDDDAISSTAPTDDPSAQDLLDMSLASYLGDAASEVLPDYQGVEDLETLPSWENRNPKSRDAWVGDFYSDNEEWIPAVDIRKRDSRVFSDVTVQAMPLSEDATLMDPAIIYSRKKSNTPRTVHSVSIDNHPKECVIAQQSTSPAGSSTSDQTQETSSAESGSNEWNHATKIWRHTSPVRGRGQQYVPPGILQPRNELSPHSSLSSDLRATAPVFVPQQQAGIFTDRPNLLFECNQPQGVVPFDPFLFDMFGIPMYHYMYPVPMGGDTGFEFNTSPLSSPSKKAGRNKNKKTWSQNPRPRGRKPRNGGSAASSQTKGPWELNPTKAVGDDGTASEPQADTTPRVSKATLAEAPNLNTGMLSVEHEASFRNLSPFAHQLEAITEQAARRNSQSNERIDWSTIHNVNSTHSPQPPFNTPQGPSNSRTFHTNPSRNSNIGFGHYNIPPFRHSRGNTGRHFRQHANNGLYADPGSYYGRRNAGVGVPLNATAPFPDPVPPKGPMRSRVEGGTPKEYIGYRASEEDRKPSEGCGCVDIVEAVEWGGGTCQKCVPIITLIVSS